MLFLAFSAILSAQAATLVYTNDVMGELEPCGCRNNPLGGMVRKANFVAKAREKDKDLLQLDAGDLLFETNVIPGPLEKQAELQADFQLQAHELLGHDAIVPGEKDLALGVKTFEKLAKKHRKVKFLAANLRKRKGGKAVDGVASSAIFRRGKKKIAVFGLVGADLPWPSDLEIAAPIAAAKKEVAAARAKKADLVIALTHEGYEADVALAKAVPGIDIIVGGHTQSFLQTPVTVKNGKGETTIYQSSFRNQYVGLVPLDEPRTAENHKLVAMDANYNDAPEHPSEMTRLVDRMKSAVAELNAKEEAKLARVEENAANPHGPKYQTFARCSECHLKQFEFWRKTPHSNALAVLVEAHQEKNKACLTCHTVGASEKDGWSNVNELGQIKKPAPKASDVPAANDDGAETPIAWPVEEIAPFLKEMRDAKDLKSEVRLTRAEDPIALRSALNRIQRAWTPVQCENCHQPGRDHPFTGSYSKTVSTDTCFKCHTAERAPGWYTKDGKPDMEKVQQKRAAMTCPAGDLPPEE